MKKAAYIILLALAAGCFSKEPVKTNHKGENLPEFNLLLSDSTFFRSTSLPSGKPVVLFFLGADCPYSHAQMSIIADNMNDLKDVEFVLLTISPFLEMKKFSEKYKLTTFHNVITGKDTSLFFLKHFQAMGVPYLAIYDRNKRFKDLFKGKVSVSQIKNETED